MSEKKEYHYSIRSAATPPTLESGWDTVDWTDVKSIEITNFRVESSDHRPWTRVKMQYDSTGLYCLFHVQDQYVKCIYRNFNDPVYKDSCVEFFVQPDLTKNIYFNFEFNCIGTLLVSCNHFQYLPDGTFTVEKNRLKADILDSIQITHSIHDVVPEEIVDPIDWELGFFIPFAIFEKEMGAVSADSGQQWRANFYKCGDLTSHPHWASWSPVEELNFHAPHCFGKIAFE